MLKKLKKQGFFRTFLSLVAFRLGGTGLPGSLLAKSIANLKLAVKTYIMHFHIQIEITRVYIGFEVKAKYLSFEAIAKAKSSKKWP